MTKHQMKYLNPWRIGNNSKTAVHEFLKKSKKFKIDKKIEDKLLIIQAS